jgi:hypothetical protein
MEADLHSRESIALCGSWIGSSFIWQSWYASSCGRVLASAAWFFTSIQQDREVQVINKVWECAKVPSCWQPEITQPCVHTCDGLFICQLYLLPDLLEETDCKEDMPLTLPFASFVSLSQLIIVIWIKTSVGITTVFYTGISRAVAAA